MIRWPDALVERIDAVISRADGGTPTTIVVEGDPGIGKSTVLDLISERAVGFRRFATEAFEATATVPYDTIAGLGIDTAGAAPNEPLTPVLAGQRLRALLDEADQAAATMLTVDDLQWADEESVNALVALMSRASGDRLLLCVGSRPLAPDAHPLWRRWSSRPNRVEHLDLTGLNREQAADLIRAAHLATDDETVDRLWEHTGGNPLYLSSLVAEHDAAALASMRVLPAPTEYAHGVMARFGRLSEPAAELVAALVVLGTGWVPAMEVAALADAADVEPVLQELLDAGLIDVRSDEVGESIRPAHALARAAIYQGLPLAQRRALHERAAHRASSAGVALEHRVAATSQYDHTLATDLEDHGNALLASRSYRLAAHFIDIARALTADPQERERRRLESLYAMLLANDRSAVTAAISEVQAAESHPKLRDLILAMHAHWERRVHEAVAILTPWSSADPVQDDVSVQYRIEALLTWARLNSGAPEADIREALDRAGHYASSDPMLSRFTMLAAAQLIARHVNEPGQIPGLSTLPDNPAAVPVEATAMLAWRGIVLANVGQFSAAISDLTELLDRMQRGLHDFSNGSYHAVLGRTQWFAGDWTMARVHLRLAAEIAGDYPPPLVQVCTPVAAIGSGDFARADEEIARARDLLARAPWLEACDQLAMVEVIRCHAEGTATAETYPAVRDGIAAVRAGSTRKTVMWNIHAGLAAVWARALEDAFICAGALDGAVTRTEWSAGVAEWLRGLASEASGDGKTALTHLRAAAAADLTGIPLYAAHVQVDHARIAHLMGDVATAGRSLDLAAETYERLDATPYLDRVAALRSTSSGEKPNPLNLSDRERDVLSLVTAGMSYKQIARDLFITQSTVSYHLGNIYAKADVTSRHQLTQQVRENPSFFGLAAQDRAFA
jgi:DNA-binding CsgD family transcriptional regulator